MMTSLTQFSPEVAEQLKFYVYRLIDPRNGQTFYVGKGKGNRVFAHVYDALKDYAGVNYEQSDDSDSAKIRRIREIRNAGLEVIHVIQRWGMDEATAFQVESAVIDCYPGLSNAIFGHNADFGVSNAIQLESLLSLKPYNEPDFPYMIIKTTQDRIDCEYCNGSLYEATRYAWKINVKKAQKYPYVFAVVNGIVKAVYKVHFWEPAPNLEGRYQFEGEPVGESFQEPFVKKRIPSNYSRRGMASPVLYSLNGK
ncbi:MAG: hypothetical protein LKJ80_02240 [Oscillibacter sp.]|jgi:hypothetical protein|nr:hypothetical protein [Oscillibacter sp.]